MPKQPAPIPFAEWRPDIALLDNSFAGIAENVYPTPNSYIPWPSLAPLTVDQLPTLPARGLTFARTATGSYVIYAGSRTKLYRWSGVAWVDVSRTSGGDYNVAESDVWVFAQYGTRLHAVNIGDAPQVIDVDAGTNFAATAGSPPHATSVAVIGDFLVLSGLIGNRRVIQWSGINDDTSWTIGLSLGDMQEFPDGGPVYGVAGGEIGYVVQDRTIRTMQFLPGDTATIFNFSRVEREKGCMAKYGFVFTRGVLFFVAEDGFYGIGIPNNPAIGAHKVNDWFLLNSDPKRRGETFCFADPRKPRVLWAFYSSDTSVYYDRVIAFDWMVGRFTYGTAVAQSWGTLAAPGVDLDTDIPGDALDIPLDSIRPSLDSTLYEGGRPIISAIDQNGILCFEDGPPMPAVIETAEGHFHTGMRAFVSGVYPLIDCPGVTVTPGARENLQEPVTFGVPLPVETTGTAPIYSSSRLHKFRVATPSAVVWHHATGVQVETQPDGEGY